MSLTDYLDKYLEGLERDYKKNIPLFQNNEFVKLVNDFEHAPDDKMNFLMMKFGDFEIEKDECITLKPDANKRDWKRTVNFHKTKFTRFMTIKAVITLANKLDEGVDLLTAINYMNESMGVAIKKFDHLDVFFIINDYHPRGTEVFQKWKEVNNIVIEKTGDNMTIRIPGHIITCQRIDS